MELCLQLSSLEGLLLIYELQVFQNCVHRSILCVYTMEKNCVSQSLNNFKVSVRIASWHSGEPTLPLS